MTDAMFSDRAVRDLLNTVTVTRDLVFYRAERPLARRIIDKMTGHDARISELIDDHGARSIENLLTLTTLLNERIAFSDETQVKVIRRLKGLTRKLDSRGAEVGDLRRHVAALEERFTADIAQLVERVDSRDAIERGFAELEHRIDHGSFSLIDLWQFADELWWGGFGLIQRRPERAELASRLRSEVVQRLQRLMKRELGLQGVFPLEPLLVSIRVMEFDRQEELDLLMLDPDAQTRPLSRVILNRASDRPEVADEMVGVPIVTTVERLSERLFAEARRSGNS